MLSEPSSNSTPGWFFLLIVGQVLCNLPLSPLTTRARPGGAAEAARSGHDRPACESISRELVDCSRPARGEAELEHLVEIAVVNHAVPADR